MLVASLSNGKEFAKNILKKNKAFSELKVETTFFPDREKYVRFFGSVEGKSVLFVQSMHPNPNDSLVELFLAAKNARDLGAKKISALVPYMGYMRQDKRFKPGEAFSAKYIAELLSSCLDELFTFDSHMHRIKKTSEVFSIPAHNLSASDDIAAFVGKKFNAKDTVIVGPDFESSQWARRIAGEIGFESTVLEKKRFSSRKVKVALVEKIRLSGKRVVIIDDIASTGHTLIEACRMLKKHGAKSVDCVLVHALLVDGALEKIKRGGVRDFFSCNTIKHPTNAIDLSTTAAGAISKTLF